METQETTNFKVERKRGSSEFEVKEKLPKSNVTITLCTCTTYAAAFQIATALQDSKEHGFNKLYFNIKISLVEHTLKDVLLGTKLDEYNRDDDGMIGYLPNGNRVTERIEKWAKQIQTALKELTT